MNTSGSETAKRFSRPDGLALWRKGVRWPRIRWFAVSLSVAAVLATLIAAQIYASMYDHGHSWWRMWAWQGLTWSYWGLLSPLIVVAGHELHRRRQRLVNTIVMLLVACVCLVGTHVVLSSLVAVWTQPYLPMRTDRFLSGLLYQSAPWSVVDLLVFWLLVAVGYARATTQQRRLLELRESRLEAELAKAQLHALQLELQPHFLFNTLNSIAALVRKRSNEHALEMLIGLSHLLRTTLDRSETQVVSLGDEVDFVRRYVQLQQQRFGERLSISYHIDEDCLELPVPTLLLQPLVENAIRHGISKRTEGGSIDLSAQRQGRYLAIRLANTGPGLPVGFSLEHTSGIGLSATLSRLCQLYGGEADLELTSDHADGTVLFLRLPLQVTPNFQAATA